MNYLDIYIERIFRNVYLYYRGFIKWSDIETFNSNYRYKEIKNLRALYNLNKDYFKENCLIYYFNNEEIRVNDCSNKELKNNFKIKVMYYIINNPNVSKNTLDQILKEMRCKNLLNNTECYYLGMLDVDETVTRFDFVFNKNKGLFDDIIGKLESFKEKAKQKFENLL